MPRLEDDSMLINDVVHRVNRLIQGEHRGSGIREDGEIKVKQHVVNICPGDIGRVLRMKRAQLGNRV